MDRADLGDCERLLVCDVRCVLVSRAGHQQELLLDREDLVSVLAELD